MKSIYLLKVDQHGTTRYVGVAPAKDLVRLASAVEMKATQDAQRPINPKRLEEIAEFVSADGLLSTSIVIGSNDSRMSVESANIPGVSCLYTMSFPETEAEYEEYRSCFDIMDGQHRLFSFLEDYCRLTDADTFEISFELYVTPTLRDKRLIFKNTNEKQEKVASNLLMWFRAQLGMLNEKEKVYHPVVELLNEENVSPLKGRIIMGAEKVTGGIKGEQLITILNKADISALTTPPMPKEKMLKLISDYLSGWEMAVGSKIADRDSSLGAFSKVSGLRFMLLLLPCFYDQAVFERAAISKEYIADKVKKLFASEGMSPSDLFNNDSDYFQDLGFNPFSGETGTTQLVKDWASRLKVLESDSFDPLA